MRLEQKLIEDMKTAMKEKDMKTLEVVRLVLSAVKNKAIELNKELEDAEVMAVIKSDVKKIKDSLESFVSNARDDLALKAREELRILESYLPEQMSDEELEKVVREKVESLGAKGAAEAGKIMGVLVKELRDRADGGRIKTIIDRILHG